MWNYVDTCGHVHNVHHGQPKQKQSAENICYAPRHNATFGLAPVRAGGGSPRQRPGPGLCSLTRTRSQRLVGVVARPARVGE